MMASRTIVILTVIRRCCTSLPLIVFVFLVLRLLDHDNNQQEQCRDLLRNGRWTGSLANDNPRREWHAYESLLYHYTTQEVHKCLQNQTLHFAGDSTIRQIFWAIAETLGGEDVRAAKANTEKHQDLTFAKDGAALSFLWDPFLNRSDTSKKIGYRSGNMLSVLLSTGLWQARFSGDDYLQATESSLYNVVEWLKLCEGDTNFSLPCSPVIMVPPPALNFDSLNPQRAQTLTEQTMRDVKHVIERFWKPGRLEVAWSTYLMTADSPSTLDETGLHVTSQTALLQANLLLNSLCNNRVLSGHKAIAHACTDSAGHSFKDWFVILCLFFAGWPILAKMLGQIPPGYLSIFQAILTLLGIASYCVLTDRTTLFGKSDKIVSQSLFVLLSCFFLSLSLCSAKRVRKTLNLELPPLSTQIETKAERVEFLSRSQTEEWKGWMQIMILFYHYFGMSKVLWVYKLVRVLVASYLFLTGYGHATYFQTTRDFSAQRLVTVMVRLNMLPILLAYFMDKTYGFYYFPGLASFWVLVTYLSFSKYSKQERAIDSMIRILTSVAVLSILLSSEHAILVLTQFLRVVHGPTFNPKELMFRVKLDFYAPYFGMATSVLVFHSEGLSKQLTLLRGACVAGIRQMLLINLALLLLISYLVVARSFANKFSYNHWHSVLSLLPIMAYMILRNASEGLQSCEVPLLRWVGTISLELFVLQYHIWLAADTKGILRPDVLDIPFMTRGKTVAGSWEFWFDTALITVVFVWLSDICARATNVITKLFVGVDDESDQSEQQRIVLTRFLVLLLVLWILNVAIQVGQA